MKIPSSFKILNTTITVEFDDSYCNRKEVYGVYIELDDKIILCKKYAGKRLKLELIIETFYHEKTHAILSAMGEKELFRNEKFVDIFARLLRQSEKTAEY